MPYLRHICVTQHKFLSCSEYPVTNNNNNVASKHWCLRKSKQSRICSWGFFTSWSSRAHFIPPTYTVTYRFLYFLTPQTFVLIPPIKRSRRQGKDQSIDTFQASVSTRRNNFVFLGKWWASEQKNFFNTSISHRWRNFQFGSVFSSSVRQPSLSIFCDPCGRGGLV